MKSKYLKCDRNWRALGLLLALAAVIIGTSQSMLPVQARETHIAFSFASVTPAAAESWTCDGTVALTGSSYSYALPTWNMSGGLGVDREKKCKERIQADWLNNGAIWQKLGIPAAQQDSYCKSGGTFRVDYGFDKRKKDWSFTQAGKPNCKCAGPLSLQ